MATSLSCWIAHTFSQNDSTRLMQTPFNIDNGRLFLAQSTNSHKKPTSQMQTLLFQLNTAINRPFLFEGRDTSSCLHVDDPSSTVCRIK